jgi:xanthine dehydrogenase small subunit
MKEKDHISFVLDGKLIHVDFRKNGELKPTTTVLNFLRSYPEHKGVKEGCAEGDCGACTVVIAESDGSEKMKYTAIDSCLVFLPMIHGKQLITVENLEQRVDGKTLLHPVQQAMVEKYGAQCGYCTPGVIMSMFALYKNHHLPSAAVVSDALTGNLCRCTGYQPIAEAASVSCSNHGKDHFTENEKHILALLAQINKLDTIAINNGEQQYYVPFTLNEALRLRKDHPDAILTNGSTDIALRQTKKHEILNKIIDLSQVAELRHFQNTDKSIIVGAGVSIELLRKISEKKLPAIYSMLSVFGSLQIRNMATIGGNIGSASPIGDSLPLLFAHRALITVKNIQSERVIPIQEFITGYRSTDLKADELIVAVEIPFPSENEIIWSHKVSKRKDLDISTVSATFNLKKNADSTIGSVILAFGGMAAQTQRAYKTEEFLLGKEWNRATVELAMEILSSEFTPISDARSFAETRRIAAKNLLLKFWAETKN